MNPFSSAVNQKLYLARLLLERCTPAQDAHGHAELALSQSAIFQLHCAYRLYLNEIASNYKVASTAFVNTADELSQALLAIDKHPAESRELQNLEQETGSWLNRLLLVYQGISQPQPLGSTETDNLIPLQSVESSTASADFALVTSVLAGFGELLDRHRELMLEF